MNARHEKLARLFEAACDLDRDAQRALLERECGGCLELQAEALALLDEDRAGTDELDTPAVDLQTTSAVPLPERIGPYRVLGRLGAGGMGVVYEAEQESPRRRVALKVLRSDRVSAAMARRFEREARVLGWLNHPGIAQIYEAGVAETETGPTPFVAMELVEGEPLLDWALGRRAEVRGRLELLARVCDAVHHAHQKSIVHRDLKPANVLVGVDGRPKVLDFGIARITGSDLHSATQHTDPGELVGTLAYMSPEQIAGDPSKLDTRSDVYALGVIAYELLTGELPDGLRGAGIQRVMRSILEEEPTRLGTRDRRLAGDIETIVGKALEKDPERRYGSAEEMAADLRRFLSHEPITARRQSTTYQLRKFARRNRLFVSAASVGLVMVLAGVVGITHQYFRAESARRASDRAHHEELLARRAEREQRSVAEGNLARALLAEQEANANAATARAEAESAIRQMKTRRAVSDLLTSIISSGDPLEGRGRDLRVVDVLEEGVRDTEALEGEPALQAAMINNLGQCLRGLGEFARAEELLTRAVEIHRTIGDGTFHELPSSLGNLAELMLYLNRPDEAEPLLREALAWPDPDSLHVIEPGRLRFGLGRVRMAQGRFHEAEGLLFEALELYEQAGVEPARIGSVLNALGMAFEGMGDLAAAEGTARRALEIMIEAHGPGHPEVAILRSNLSNTLRLRGDLEGAEEQSRLCIDTLERYLDPSHPHLSMARGILATALAQAGELDEAEELFRSALESFELREGADGLRVATTLSRLADVADARGDHETAAGHHSDALAIRLGRTDSDHPDVVMTRAILARSLRLNGDLVAAENVVNEALDVPPERLPLPVRERLAKEADQLAQALLAAGEAARATRLTEASMGRL